MKVKRSWWISGTTEGSLELKHWLWVGVCGWVSVHAEGRIWKVLRIDNTQIDLRLGLEMINWRYREAWG